MAGFYSNEGKTGPDADYSNKNINIRNYMKNIGVAETDIYVNHYNTIRPQTDSIGVTIGKRQLCYPWFKLRKRMDKQRNSR